MKFNKLFIINFLNILFLELIFKLVVFKNLFTINLLYLLVFSFFNALILTIILRLIPQKVSKILIHIFWGIISLIFLADFIYFKYYNTIVGIGALEYTGQVMGFKSSIIQTILNNLHFMLIFLIPNITLFFTKKYIQYDKLAKKEICTTVLTIVAMMFFTILSLFIKGNTNKDILFQKNNMLLSTERFGLISSIGIDALKSITNFQESYTKPTETKKEEPKPEIEYNITNINFNELAGIEKKESIKNLHRYFDTVSPTNKNKYTGLFKGKNLIFIVAEAFYPIAINKELTPTLYRLSQEGFNFTNFYQPIYGCSTSDGEFTSLYSLLPGAATCTMKITSKNYYPYSLGTIFGETYSSYAFHGGSHKYYSRNKTLPNLGFDYYACGNGLKINCKSWPQSDVEVVEDSLKYFINKEHFVTYYMSISGHLEYNFYGNLIARKNKSLVENLEESEAIKAYIATQIEFDRSLELLINELNKNNILDDTVIAIVPDHYPYGLTNDEIKGYTGITDTTYEMYKNSFILYNSEMEKPVKVDKYASNIDVLPTILNLFGVEYDSRILIGKDILSDSEGIVIFNNFNWINKFGKYNYAKNKFTSFNPEQTLNEKEIDKINIDIQNKFSISKLIVEEDYYKFLFK